MSGENGQISFSKFSIAELYQALDSIDVAQNRTGSIPAGEHGLIEIPLNKKFVLPFKIVMLIAAIPFLVELYEIIMLGEARLRTFTAVKGEHWGYYAELSKVGMISLFLLWLGTLGVRAKDELSDAV